MGPLTKTIVELHNRVVDLQDIVPDGVPDEAHILNLQITALWDSIRAIAEHVDAAES